MTTFNKYLTISTLYLKMCCYACLRLYFGLIIKQFAIMIFRYMRNTINQFEEMIKCKRDSGFNIKISGAAVAST